MKYADLRAQVQRQRAAIREYLAAWMDTTEHPSGESSSYSVDAAERLERATAELKRIAEADDA